MKFKDIQDKILKGETLTDEEKEFLKNFDPEKEKNAAAKSAREAAEAKAEKDATALKEKLEEATKTADDKAKGADDAFKSLQKEVAKLTKANEEATAKIVKQERTSAIHGRFKALGFKFADGIDETVAHTILDMKTATADVSKQDELDVILNAFKSENPAMFLSSVNGGANVPGQNPSTGAYTGPNPFSKKSPNLDKAIELDITNPDLAKKLKAEADAEA